MSNNAAGPSGNNAGSSRKRKTSSNSLKAREKNARECNEYDKIMSPILRGKIQLTNTAARVTSTGEIVSRKSVETFDGLLCRAENATPKIKCESQPCTGHALWGANSQTRAGPMRCEDHKKDGDVFVRCSECDTASPLVSVGGKPMCLAHASIRVIHHEMPSESESIVDIRGKHECACGTSALFGLTEKKQLACRQCACVCGALMNVTFEYIKSTPDHSKYTCAVDRCTKYGAYKTTVDSKLYCAAHRNALLDAEKDANRSFGERAMFKKAALPCPGWTCSNAGCTVEAVVERRGTDAGTGTTETGTTGTGTTDRLERLCMEHWNEIPDDGVKKSYSWTGTCYAQGIYGSCRDDIRGTRDRCGTHKLPTDVNNHNSRCVTCVASIGWSDATRVRKNGDECQTCGGIKDTGWSPRFRECLALDAFRHKCMSRLESPGATIAREKRPPQIQSDPAYRADLAIDRGTHVEIVEIDEDAHGSRDQCDELKRLQAVVQWDARRPVNVYRVNPDRPGFKISKKVTKAWVRGNSDGGAVTRRYLADELEIPGVNRENLDRTVGLLEQAMFEKNWENCVVYIDYPVDNVHLAPFLKKDGTKTIGESGGYADFVIVPRDNFFAL